MPGQSDNSKNKSGQSGTIQPCEYRRDISSGSDYFSESTAGSDSHFFSDYQETAIDSGLNEKIACLNKIILSIESKNHTHQLPDLQKKNFTVNYSSCLNNAQLAAVTAMDGPVLVIAGAGSGKTRVIVYRVSYLLENGINPQDILLLTFTRKAAKEMLHRVGDLLKNKSTDKITGGTFHSFSNFLLRKYAHLLNIKPNFTIIDTEDASDIIDLIRTDMKLNSSEKKFPAASRLQDIFSMSRNCNKTIETILQENYTGILRYVSEISDIYRRFAEYKINSNIFDYDDLMEFLKNSLRDNIHFRKSVQNTYRYILVDEYQDTNLVQKEIVDLLSETHRNVMVVGDDSQSIYSFRGANYENILRFPETYTDCLVIKIEQNYRSNQKILDFTNAIIHNAKLGYKKKLFSSNSNDCIPAVCGFYNQELEAEFVVRKILEFRERGIPLHEMAVLVRAVWHCRYIEMELSKRGIPYIVYGGIRFSERRHVKDILSFLRILLNPSDAAAWHRVLKLIDGIGTVTAGKIIDEIKASGGFCFTLMSGKKYYPGLQRLEKILTRTINPEMPVSEKIIRIKEYYTPILQLREDDYEVRLPDIDVLIDLSLKYDSLEKFLTDFALDPPSKRFQHSNVPLIDEGEEKPLIISTVHSAKGLEWYTVFVPHALDGLFPSVRSLKNIEDIEEERRLFYVACSRAKESLYITMPSFVSSYGAYFSKPARFLAEMEHGRYEYIGIENREESTLQSF